MKKLKQVLAILTIIILVGLYLFTLVAAILDDPNTMQYLGASIGATAVIPVLLWVILTFFIKKKDDGSENE